MAFETDDDGKIYFSPEIPYSSREFAKELHVSSRKVQEILEKLRDFCVIKIENNIPQFLSWNDRQFVTDVNSADRSRASRSKKCNVAATSHNSICNVIDTDTDTDTEKKKKIHTSHKNGSCPHDSIVDLYHEVLPNLPRIKEWTPSRQSLLRARWNENKERQSVEWWRKFFSDVSQSDFLMGKVNEFKADLEWLIRPKNFPKVLEGRYSKGSKQHSVWDD
jgi:hypothetical protein